VNRPPCCPPDDYCPQHAQTLRDPRERDAWFARERLRNQAARGSHRRRAFPPRRGGVRR
jgi:hypothetical protein